MSPPAVSEARIVLAIWIAGYVLSCKCIVRFLLAYILSVSPSWPWPRLRQLKTQNSNNSYHSQGLSFSLFFKFLNRLYQIIHKPGADMKPLCCFGNRLGITSLDHNDSLVIATEMTAVWVAPAFKRFLPTTTSNSYSGLKKFRRYSKG